MKTKLFSYPNTAPMLVAGYFLILIVGLVFNTWIMYSVGYSLSSTNVAYAMASIPFITGFALLVMVICTYSWLLPEKLSGSMKIGMTVLCLLSVGSLGWLLCFELPSFKVKKSLFPILILCGLGLNSGLMYLVGNLVAKTTFSHVMMALVPLMAAIVGISTLFACGGMVKKEWSRKLINCILEICCILAIGSMGWLQWIDREKAEL